jgi:flagellar biosynthesis protein FlhF
MNIRRFTAADMRAALGAIRDELGADAVMLSSRKLAHGVEVIAAIDYDDSLLAAVGEREQPGGAAEPAGADGVSFDLPEFDAEDVEPPFGGDADLAAYERVGAAVSAERAPQVAAHGAVPPVAAIDASASMTEEIKDLRRLLEMQLASFAWNDLNRRAPVRSRVLRELHKLGVDPALASQLADQVPADCDSREALRTVVRRLGERLPIVQPDMAVQGGVFAFVGPTGVGKTTTIAKIAARFALEHSVDELGLVSTDSYRVGARQQLSSFARILRAPMQFADTAAELARVLDGFARKKLVLIDTAGMSQRDVRLAGQFDTLKAHGRCVQTVLTLSAGADRGCLAEAVAVFKAAAPEALIVTKLDEAVALGPVISLAIRSGLPLAYLSDGQRVPEDLHLAAPKRFWLLHNAVKLALAPAFTPSEEELADTYGQMELAVNA